MLQRAFHHQFLQRLFGYTAEVGRPFQHFVEEQPLGVASLAARISRDAGTNVRAKAEALTRGSTISVISGFSLTSFFVGQMVIHLR